MPILLSLAAFLMTLLGGLVADASAGIATSSWASRPA